jgi:hypothetical protein
VPRPINAPTIAPGTIMSPNKVIANGRLATAPDRSTQAPASTLRRRYLPCIEDMRAPTNA